jgi:hypothetical protein
MRKPITQASFHDSVRSWSYQQFRDRFSSQMSDEEIDNFAKALGIQKITKPVKSAKTETSEDITLPG